MSARDRTPWGTFNIHPSHLTTGPLSSTPGTPARTQQELQRALLRISSDINPAHIRPAARTVALASTSPDDCRQLLHMLGLHDALTTNTPEA